MFIFTIFTSQIFWIISWLIVFVAALVIEIAVPGLVSIWFCGGALASLMLAIFEIPSYIQIITFVGVSGILLFLSKIIFKKTIGKPKNTPTNADAIVGQLIQLLTPCSLNSPGEGQFRDVVWTVKTDIDVKFGVGEFAVVKEIKGNHLMIAKKEEK